MKTFGSDKNFFYVVLGAVGIVVAILFFWSMQRQTDSTGSPGVPVGEFALQPSLYTNSDFKISLQYPQAWKPDAAKGGFHGVYLAFRGEDGYFGIDAVGAGKDIPIDQAVRDMVSASGHPYGLNPTETQTTISGMEARLVLPSSDQPPDHAGEAAFIVRYPKPFMIASSTYFYFILYGDKGHIQAIADTLQFSQ
jgi:hypothetical protein